MRTRTGRAQRADLKPSTTMAMATSLTIRGAAAEVLPSSTPQTTTYKYDAQNRLTNISAANVSFAYDGRNRGVMRSINGAKTFFYYDGWNVIEEENTTSGTSTQYIHGARVDELIAAVTPTATTYYHHDALGSTIALTDTSGTLAELLRPLFPSGVAEPLL